ncbi:hypothetical protein T4A_5315 [Trichinella pseudospiralis]|uniref:Uncharacterized protein n=1 Tax=Trichinella pseudospiralis TaxID=6337 RepID=A0A0V1EM96_TRIPS|nr:hypothetical protein T4A_5315 [Trichinella pseudospiralis]
MLSTAAQQNSDGIRASYNISLLITQTRKSKVQLEKSYYVAVYNAELMKWRHVDKHVENYTIFVKERMSRNEVLLLANARFIKEEKLNQYGRYYWTVGTEEVIKQKDTGNL